MRRLIAFAFVALTAVPVFGQDKPLPPPRDFKPETKEARDVLPALTLPEYVITGSDMISFTEDRKSAVAAPDSREFTTRAGRGSREARFLDTSPTRMPLRKPDLTGSDEVLRVRAGLGTFSTPLIDAWYADRYALGDASAHMAYEKSSGHVQHADYSRFGFDLKGGTYLPRTLHPLLASSRLQGDVEVEAQEYGLYADKIIRAVPELDFRRKVFGLAAGVDLVSRRNTWLDHSLRLSFGHHAVDETFAVRDSVKLDEYSQVENRFGLDGEARALIAKQDVQLGISMHVTDLSEGGPDRTRPFHLRAGAGTVFPLAEDTRLEAGASMYYYGGSDAASHFRLYPSLLLRQQLWKDWSVFGGWLPEVRERTLREFLRVNPYLMLASEIRHTDAPLRFELGVEFDNRRQSNARFSLEYLSSTSWPRFSLLPDPVRQQWEMRYDGRADILTFRGAIEHAFSSDTRIHAGLDLRTSSLGEHQGRVPYLPDYEARVLISHDFPFGLQVRSTLQLVGEEEADGGALPAWMMLGLDLEYRVVKNFGVFLRFDNLLDRSWQRWPGYRERPFFMMGGVTAHF